jgi:hypothetical protein
MLKSESMQQRGGGVNIGVGEILQGFLDGDELQKMMTLLMRP